MLTDKALYCLGPVHLENCPFSNPVCEVRSSQKALPRVPLASEVQLVGTRRWVFFMVAPRLRNSLSRDACRALSLITFRHQMKLELFGWAFNLTTEATLTLSAGFYAYWFYVEEMGF